MSLISGRSSISHQNRGSGRGTQDAGSVVVPRDLLGAFGEFVGFVWWVCWVDPALEPSVFGVCCWVGAVWFVLWGPWWCWAYIMILVRWGLWYVSTWRLAFNPDTFAWCIVNPRSGIYGDKSLPRVRIPLSTPVTHLMYHTDPLFPKSGGHCAHGWISNNM